jgi:hypothetical protein
MELGELGDFQSYLKYQGQSYTLLLLDEAGQFPTPDLLDLLRSNLRSATVPIRVIVAANPGGAGHGFLFQRYAKNEAWKPFIEESSKRTFINCPSTYLDNPHVDQSQYADQLRAATAFDPELQRAWLEGSWTINRGAFFGPVYDPARNVVEPWATVPAVIRGKGYRMSAKGANWSWHLAHDFGVSAPSVTYLMAQPPPGGAEMNGQWFPQGSYICVDEIATNVPGKLNEGLGWSVPILADEIVKMCKRYGVRPIGFADDAIFAKTGSMSGSIAEEFRRAGVFFQPARKADRISGWQTLRRLLADAGKPDVPGLYLSRLCEYAIATLPVLERDPRRVEDLDSRGPDHACDALRYGVIADRMKMRMPKVLFDH